MLDAKYLIKENLNIAPDIFRMELSGDIGHIKKPGQFVNIKLEGFYLRRPISVCDLTDGGFVIIYKVVGGGTAQMSRMNPGETLNILTGLGNGYDTSVSCVSPVLIGGGVGVPPLYLLAKRLIGDGKKVTAILGFNTAGEVFLADEMEKIGVCVTVATMDGSLGFCGTAADALRQLCASGGVDYTFSCGPEPMLKAVYDAADIPGQFSFERRMGCGFGACMGCSCKTKYGSVRICREGPVLEREAIIW